MQKVNLINFSLLYKLHPGEGVFLKFTNCPEYKDILVQMECNAEKHDHIWSVSLYFADSTMNLSTDQIGYSYYVAKFNNCREKLRDILDEKTLQPLSFSFKRGDYFGKYLRFFDRCDSSLSETRRIQTLQLDGEEQEIVTTNIRIAQEVPDKRYLYIFLSPSVDPRTLEQDKTKAKYQKDILFIAERMEKSISDNKQQVWTFKHLTTAKQLQRQNQQADDLKFFIYESSKGNRQSKDWKFMNSLLEGQEQKTKIQTQQQEEQELKEIVSNLQEMSNILLKAGIKYEIVQQTGKQQLKLTKFSNLQESEISKQSEFIYDCGEDTEKSKLFTIYLVIKEKGKYKMSSDSAKRFWHVKVSLFQWQLQGLEYYISLNFLSGEEQQQNYSLRTFPEKIQKIRKGQSVEIFSKTPAINKYSYLTSFSFSNDEGQNQKDQYWIQHRAIPSQLYYFPEGYKIIWPQARAYTKHIPFPHSKTSSKKDQTQPHSEETINNEKEDKSAQIYQLMQNDIEKKRDFKSGIVKELNRMVNSSFDFGKDCKDILFKINLVKERKQLPDQLTSSLNSLRELVETVIVLNQQASYLKEKFNFISNLDLSSQSSYEYIQGAKFSQEYSPLEIEAILSTNKEETFVQFQNRIGQFIPLYSALKARLEEMRQSLNEEDRILKKIHQMDFKKFKFALMTQVKRWAQTGFQSHQGIINLLKDFFLPQISEHSTNQQLQESKELILNIAFYLNDHVHNKRDAHKLQILKGKPHESTKKHQKQHQKKFEMHEHEAAVHKQVSLHLQQMREHTVKVKPFEFIKNNQLFKLLAEVADFEGNQLDQFNKEHKLGLFHDSHSEYFMRFLINYAVVYSLGHYCCKNFHKFDTCKWKQLKKFSQQIGENAHFSVEDLKKIQQMYHQLSQHKRKELKEKQQELNTIENGIIQVIQTVEDEMDLKLMQVQFKVNRMKQHFDNDGNRKQFINSISLCTEQYMHTLKKLDEHCNLQEKIMRVIELRDEKYFKQLFSSFG